MCLAEALLRIPDKATRDALIRDKISNGQWDSHLGKSPSLFVNAATWGLLITGKLVATHSESSLGSSLSRLIGQGGEPLIRKGVQIAMRMMGEQFVTGETIDEALRNARTMEAEGFRYSYDMLGEAALTSEDAKRYYADYEQAIHAIGGLCRARHFEGPASPSSSRPCTRATARADRPRDGRAVPAGVAPDGAGQKYDIGLNIDAEETDRLELSLDLLERLCHEPTLAGWNGIGFVIQAYQKRCPFVIDYVVDLARRTQRRLMVRLVKGAYWDSEIKRAQVDGLDGLPRLHPQGAHRHFVHRLRQKLLAAPDVIPSSPRTTRKRWPPSTTWRAATTTPGSTSSSACTAWASRCTNRWWAPSPAGKLGGRPRRIYAPWARTKPCWPTWCAACWRTAPTPRS